MDAVESLQGGIHGVLCRNARSQTPKGQMNFHARTYGKINIYWFWWYLEIIASNCST